MSEIQLEETWKRVLLPEFSQDYFRRLKDFLVQEKKSGQIVYPPSSRIFAAMDSTPFEKVKVVIIGQDPYHGPGQANGLCFSVAKGIPVPPSLKNIYKELASDIGFSIPAHGDLSEWAERGVLLLNASLTVRAHQAGSHQKKGWENFTDEIIRQLSLRRKNLVFLLWGNFARSKKTLITGHHILEAAHPSPLSAHNGFLGCKHFSKTNQFLTSVGVEPVDWQLT